MSKRPITDRAITAWEAGEIRWDGGHKDAVAGPGLRKARARGATCFLFRFRSPVDGDGIGRASSA